MCFGQKIYTHQQKRKHKNPFKGQELNRGPLAPHSYAIALDPIDNLMYRLKLSYLTVST